MSSSKKVVPASPVSKRTTRVVVPVTPKAGKGGKAECPGLRETQWEMAQKSLGGFLHAEHKKVSFLVFLLALLLVVVIVALSSTTTTATGKKPIRKEEVRRGWHFFDRRGLGAEQLHKAKTKTIHGVVLSQSKPFIESALNTVGVIKSKLGASVLQNNRVISNVINDAVVATTGVVSGVNGFVNTALTKLVEPAPHRELLDLVAASNFKAAKAWVAARQRQDPILWLQDAAGSTILKKLIKIRHSHIRRKDQAAAAELSLLVMNVIDKAGTGLCNVQDMLGSGCLHILARFDDVQLLKTVISARPSALNYNLRSSVGATPLMVALRHQHDDSAIMLVDHTQNPNERVAVLSY